MFWRYLSVAMFLRATIRKKDGKEHRYWSLVENKRVGGGRVVQRHVLYLGEINSSQELAWRKAIEVLEDGGDRPRTLSLFPEDRGEGMLPGDCIGSGTDAAPWRICWGRTQRSRTVTNCTVATTGCWRTSRRCSIILWGGGGICSTPPSTCCC